MTLGWLSAAYAAPHYDELPHGFSVSIKIAKSKVTPEEQVLARFAYTNHTDQTVRLLKWGTPFEGRINEDILIIMHDGETVDYVGRHYKRSPATEDDFLVFKAGETKTTTVDLLTAYDFDFAGNYTIALRNPGFDPSLKENKINIVSVNLSADRLISSKLVPTVSNCPDGQGSLPDNRFDLIDQSIADAEVIALQASNDLRQTPIESRASAERYLEWFGAYVETNWDLVQNNFDLIYAATRDQTITVICDDRVPYYAYVYPDQPYVVYLGRAFWFAPALGTDSKAGVMIHELSHFDILADTSDTVYGQTLARSLAINNPLAAINNADSVEYFAENTPFLSMPDPLPPVVTPPTTPSGEGFDLMPILMILLDELEQ